MVSAAAVSLVAVATDAGGFAGNMTSEKVVINFGGSGLQDSAGRCFLPTSVSMQALQEVL